MDLINTALIGVISLLLGLLVKIAVARMNDVRQDMAQHHQEAMNHLSGLKASVDEVRESLTQHIRDHATKAFNG